MTDQEINIAIAEACGWKKCPFDDVSYYVPMMGKMAVACNPCHDLNAMNKAEETLNDYQKTQMVANLGSIRKKCGFVFHSTARQRAEAFLRTIGKWKE